MQQPYPIIHRLPDDYLLLIGEIVSVWAVVEYELNSTVYFVLGMGPKRGRTAVRAPRASELVDMIRDLLIVDGVSLRVIDLKAMSTHLDELEQRRNTLAHNVWMQDDAGTLFVQSVRGAWPAKPGQAKRTRRMEPAGIPVSPASLADVLRAMRQMLADIPALRADIAAQLKALPQTLREQVDPMHSHFGRGE